MKKKSLAALLSGLLTISLTGVGFASWIITGNGSSDASGTINVETVDDRRVVITKDTSKTNDTNVVFGQPSSTTIGESLTGKSIWLKPSSGIKDEDLTAVFNFKITNAKYAKLDAEPTGDLKTYIDNGYITMSDTYVYGTGATETNEQTLVMTLTFGWGIKFGGENPYIYYNKQDVSDPLIEKAITDVNELAKLTSLSVTLKGTYTEA